MFPLESLNHVEGMHPWHLLIDKLHVETIIVITREAYDLEMCATCSMERVSLYSGEDI